MDERIYLSNGIFAKITDTLLNERYVILQTTTLYA